MWQHELCVFIIVKLHMEELNLKHQAGKKKKVICDLARQVRKFISKLKLFTKQTMNYDL